jgi:ABC-type transporter Mla MlaB component
MIEVDGDLDIVTAHDLRRAYADAELLSARTIEMDLSRVGAADRAGIDVLAWCVERAVATRATLTWSTCSQPLTGAISASARTTRTRVTSRQLSA